MVSSFSVYALKKIDIHLDDELVKELELICKEENLILEEAIVKLLRKGIDIWKKEFTLNMLKNGKWTIGKAARFLGLSFKQMVKMIEENKIELGERNII